LPYQEESAQIGLPAYFRLACAMMPFMVRRTLFAVFLLLSAVHGGRHSHPAALESMEHELSERVGVTASGKFSRQQKHHRPNHVERREIEELDEADEIETQVMQLPDPGGPVDAHVEVSGAGELELETFPDSIDTRQPGSASGDGTQVGADEPPPSNANEAPGEVLPDDPDVGDAAPSFDWPSDEILPGGSGQPPPEERSPIVDAVPPESIADGAQAQPPNMSIPILDDDDLSSGEEFDAAGRLPNISANLPGLVADRPLPNESQEDGMPSNSTAPTNSTPEVKESGESQSDGKSEGGAEDIDVVGDSSEGDVSEGEVGEADASEGSESQNDATIEAAQDGAEDAEPVEPELPAGGVAEVAAHAVEEVTEAGVARPEHAEVNLGVIRQFPHMAVWEARLHQAIRDSGDSGKCSDISDSAFKGYGCAIKEHDKPACECRGGHEECLRHSSEDVFDYLWLIKDNKTVDETIMRELLAGRCDYMGGHEINQGEVIGIILALLLPFSAACALCFCPAVVGVYVWGKKRRQKGKRRAGRSETLSDRPLVESSSPQPDAVSEVSEHASDGLRTSGEACP